MVFELGLKLQYCVKFEGHLASYDQSNPPKKYPNFLVPTCPLPCKLGLLARGVENLYHFCRQSS
jgi:hypothetical protein